MLHQNTGSKIPLRVLATRRGIFLSGQLSEWSGALFHKLGHSALFNLYLCMMT